MNKRTIKRITAVLMALIVAMAIVPSVSYAKTVAVTNISSGMTKKQLQKKAKVIKKGNTTIKVNDKEGYVKFKAPSKKTYTFTFYDLKLKDDTPILFGGIAKLKSNGSWKLQKTRSNEGIRNIWLLTNSSVAKAAKQEGATYTIAGKKCKYLAKRYAKVALKKGETVYIDLWGSASGTVRVNIK